MGTQRFLLFNITRRYMDQNKESVNGKFIQRIWTL